jgi:hypothetical protein
MSRNVRSKLLSLLPLFALVCALVSTGLYIVITEAASVPWYRGIVTQHYGVNQEHGVDIETNYKPITALLPGRVTSVYVAKWEWPNPTVITWQLTHPVCSRGHCADYMYVQIKNSAVWKHEHIVAGQRLGWSRSFIEIGFVDYPCYGAGYPWTYSGIDPLRVWPWL